MDTSKLSAEVKRDIKAAKTLLKEEGCTSVFLFGSTVTGKSHKGSDLDIGITGLPPEKFFKVYSKLDSTLTSRVDLVDFDERKDFYNLLSRLGEVVEVG